MTLLKMLFQQGKIGSLEIKNRIYMPPMVSGTADDDGYVTPRMIDYYLTRAKGGVGMISCQSSCILDESRAPRRLFVYDDKFIPKLRELTAAIHQYGTKVALELAHWGVVAVHHLSGLDHSESIKVVAPSRVLYVPANFIPQEATQDDIDRIIAGFAQSARRIKDSNFDAIEIHGAHGRLIGQFLSPFWNRRKDKYGGSVENKARFACEVIFAIRKEVGPDFPIIFRLSGSDFMEGSITLEHTLIHAPMFVEAGANALHISASTPGSYHWQFPCYLFPDGNLVHLAESIKKEVKVPVIAVGKIGDPLFAERILEEGKCDFVAMGRALLADPELPRKAEEGRFEDIRRCLYCNNCIKHGKIADSWAKEWYVRCTINPALCREKEFEPRPADKRKKVFVAGGGLAGMEAARVLAERGHDVFIYEKDNSLGGQWRAASAAGHDRSGNFERLLKQMIAGLQKAGVKVITNRELTAQLVKEAEPDAIVVATGAMPKVPDVPGVQGRNVIQAKDVFLGKAQVGDRVVVIGGSHLGLEVANLLSERGKRVSVVEQAEIGMGMQHDIFSTLLEQLIERGVQFFRYSPLVEVLDRGVFIDFQKDLTFLRADTIILAVGVQPVKELAFELENLVQEIYLIGDASSPRDAREAIYEGAEVGRKL